jgi:hypothetical protein
MEKEIDRRFNKLEKKRFGGDAFDLLLDGMRTRNEYEQIAADYLSLSGKGSKHISLKVLQVLDFVRSRGLSVQGIRFAPIGPRKRSPWRSLPTGKVPSECCQLHKHTQSRKETTSLRKLRLTPSMSLRPFLTPPNPNATDFEERDASGTNILDLSDVLVLHLGFLGNGLVVALDTNLELFVYGNESSAKNRLVDKHAFRQYGIDPLALKPENIIFGPVVRPNVRNRLVQLANRLHEYFEKHDEYPSSDFLRDIVVQLEELIGYQDVAESIKQWAISQNRSLANICLIILPDEDLFLLPLSFLGASRGEPLVTNLGGVSVALSLIALKWMVKDYHWTTLPNLSKESPHCTLFTANGDPPLSLNTEIKAVNQAFGPKNCFVLAEADRGSFMQLCTAGDVCWFAGHAEWNPGHGFHVRDANIPFILSGPTFSDGPLTNWDLIATSHWNFKVLWLTVMNCCLLGKSLLVGANPLGFMSALHTVGSIATIAALWPVVDKAAVNFARSMSREIVAHFEKERFPRARAFSEALRKAIGNDIERLWLFAPYVLWGLP